MAKVKKFGTFGGVFVPSILTILGVIMYLRLPQIVGEAGLWYTLGIIVVAHIISVTTGLSISSMATDKKVEAGGPYYIISRSLGLPIGGTLGLALFVGLSFSISLYLIGFSESFLPYLGFSIDISNIRIVGSLALIALTIITFISTSLAIKAQFFILIAIVLSLISIFFGQHEFGTESPLFLSSPNATSIMVLFGIFFPAVTGFSAGVSMSGDLENPKRAIPKGTIAAIVTGFIIYVVLAIFFSLSVSREALTNDSQILLNTAWIPELVVAGIWGATLSSALGSILGAPRIMQAIAVDKIGSRFFAKGYGPTKEPRNAVLLAFVIAEAGILIGELDIIARIVSIFFITTYGFLNISAAFEKWTSTDYRPDFKVSGWISLIGAIACLIVMIQLDLLALIGAVLILGLTYFLLKKRELTLDSGDAWSGVWASLVKTGLTNLMKDRVHNRNWRPNMIMFSGNPNNRMHMIEIGKAIAGKLGILTAFELVKSDDRIMAKTESNLERGKDAIGYFKHKLHCRDIYSGMDQIARVYGFSGVEPNTILMGWSKIPTNEDRFLDLIESFASQNFNTLFLNYDHDKGYGNGSTIDIWWSGSGRNLSLSFGLVRSITSSALWKSAKIRVLIINREDEESENIYKKTAAILDRFRLPADVKIINNEKDQLTDLEIISKESGKADLVLLGVPDQEFKNFRKSFSKINEIVEHIGSSLIINASEDFEELEVIDQNRPKLVTKSEDRILAMPPLPESKFPEITSDIWKIDRNGQEVFNRFYDQAFKPIFDSHRSFLEELLNRIDSIKKEVKKIEETPELLKRKKAIDKLKNESLFKMDLFINEEISEVSIPYQTKQMEEGISWCLDQLSKDFRRFPKHFTIKYADEDFAISKDDNFRIRSIKRGKKLKHLIVGRPITQTINYRELARYYQLNTRMVFLKKLLQQLQKDETKFYESTRKLIGNITDALNDVERQIWEESELELQELFQLEVPVKKTRDELESLDSLYQNRLLAEFRKNLIQMQRDMERLDTDHVVRKRSKKKKYYARHESFLKDFSERFEVNTHTIVNLLVLELKVHAIRNRQETQIIDFWENMKMVVYSQYIKKVDTICSKLTQSDPEKALKIKVDTDFEADLQEQFEEHQAKIISLTEELPEKIEIFSLLHSDHEPISIPVSRMAEYYIKSRYESPSEENFEQLMDALKRAILTTQDAMNLARFNLENEEQTASTEKEILEGCKAKIEKEKDTFVQYLENFQSGSEKLLESAYEPLESIRIEESAEDYSSGLRVYQSQQVLSGAEAILERIKQFSQGAIAKLLYRQSEATLFANQLVKSQKQASTNSMLLDLKEQLSPPIKGIEPLPQYYTSLFNGKSNISKDLWIKRPIEEALFKKAVKRHRGGHYGGILLLGDRNSGKTAFSKHVTQQIFKSSSVFHLFPPIPGSSSVEGFEKSLAKAVQKRGTSEQMLSRLAKNSILIIHDLELFWERSEDGLAVIDLIGKLIDQFGDRVLFVANMNAYAYKLINELTSFEEHFIEIINMAPFDAEELSELVLKRHKSSGLKIHFDEKSDQLSELQLASLFHSYFKYSHGSPGVTLNGWLSNIKNANKEYICVQKPEYPTLDVFDKLGDDWTMLIIQFVLHKRLSIPKMVRITGWSEEEVKEKALAMQRSGLITEKTGGIYNLDPVMYPFILDALKEREVLQ
ncbi:amino acid permease [Ekhidna sp.]|uniref:amino acid permease n=1 Tax=Ekhidna sp. TaxID=2608089 RepID=UPI003BA99DE1